MDTNPDGGGRKSARSMVAAGMELLGMSNHQRGTKILIESTQDMQTASENLEKKQEALDQKLKKRDALENELLRNVKTFHATEEKLKPILEKLVEEYNQHTTDKFTSTGDLAYDIERLRTELLVHKQKNAPFQNKDEIFKWADETRQSILLETQYSSLKGALYSQQKVIADLQGQINVEQANVDGDRYGHCVQYTKLALGKYSHWSGGGKAVAQTNAMLMAAAAAPPAAYMNPIMMAAGQHPLMITGPGQPIITTVQAAQDSAAGAVVSQPAPSAVQIEQGTASGAVVSQPAPSAVQIGQGTAAGAVVSQPAPSAVQIGQGPVTHADA